MLENALRTRQVAAEVEYVDYKYEVEEEDYQYVDGKRIDFKGIFLTTSSQPNCF